MLLYYSQHKLKYIKIPKNACSTMINTLGDISGEATHEILGSASGDVIHKANRAFLQKAPNSQNWPVICVYRDPYARLVSAYLDKIVRPYEKKPYAHKLEDQIWLEQRHMERIDKERSVTFREFARYVCSRMDMEIDQHWRSQSYFIDVMPTITLNFSRLTDDWNKYQKLKHIKISNFAPHATHSSLQMKEEMADVNGEELLRFKEEKGQFPPKSCFYDKEIEDMLRLRYAMDYTMLSGFEGKAVDYYKFKLHILKKRLKIGISMIRRMLMRVKVGGE